MGADAVTAVDLIDFWADTVNTFDQLDRIESADHDADKPVRLVWKPHDDQAEAGDAATSAFAFKPRYSYEHEAVGALNLHATSSAGWFACEGASAAETLERLLDSVLVFGRPIIAGRADFSLPLELDEDVYCEILSKCRKAACQKNASASSDDVTDKTASSDAGTGIGTGSVSDDDAVKPPADERLYGDNLMPDVRRLLASGNAGQSSESETFQWMLAEPDQATIRALEQSFGKWPDCAEQVPAADHSSFELTLDVTFMPEHLLVLRWRLELPLRSRFATVSNDGERADLRSLLQAPFRRGSIDVADGAIQLAQSRRWLKRGFAAQAEEGKTIEAGVKSTLYHALKRCATSCGAQGVSALDAPGIPSDVAEPLVAALDRYIDEGLDRRLFTAFHLLSYCSNGGVVFNGAMDRLFAHVLFLDAPIALVNGVSDNFSYDPAFSKELIEQSVYNRWASTGVLFGMTSYSTVSVGTSWFYRNKMLPEHTSGLYADLTRLCIYQRAALRRFGRRLGSCRVDADDWRQLSRRLGDVRRDFWKFDRHGWFQEVSGEVQPAELYRLQARQLGLETLYFGIRDELANASAYMDIVRGAEEEKIQRQRNWRLTMAGLAIGAPTLILGWQKEAGEGVVDPLFRMIFDGRFIILCLLIGVAFWFYRLVRPSERHEDREVRDKRKRALDDLREMR